MTPTTVDRYVRHAERFGVELVFETAAGLGEARASLSSMELVTLARRLKAIDPKFDPAKPDKLVELTSADVREAYLDRVAVVLDAFATPMPTRARRACEWCGKAIAGRADRRTCSPSHRKALERASGVGPFSRPDVTPTGGADLSIASSRSVTPTARRDGRNEGEKRGGSRFREVAEISGQLDLFEVGA